MRVYELVCAFRVKEGQDVAGIEAVKRILNEASASIQSEENIGDRELAYAVDNETRGRYRLFNVELEQEKLPTIEDALKLTTEILRYVIVVKGE